MRFAFCAVLAVLPFCLHAAVVVGTQNLDNELRAQDARAGRSDEPPQSANGWAVAGRIAGECARDPEPASCVAVKAAVVFERAARLSGTVDLFSGVVTVARNGEDSQRDSRSLPTEQDLRGQLSAEPADHVAKATDMVFNSALRFLQSRTLQFKMPQTNPEELSRAIEEGRGKLKKKILPILSLLAVKIVAVLPFALGIIGFFALKALVLGKLALIIASVMAFQKYAGSSGGFGKFAENFSSAGPWSQPAAPVASGGYYRRSIEQNAQQMAYNGQAQQSAQNVA